MSPVQAVRWDPPTAEHPYGVFVVSDGARLAPTTPVRAQGFGGGGCWMSFQRPLKPGVYYTYDVVDREEVEIVEAATLSTLLAKAEGLGFLKRLASPAAAAMEGHETRFANLEVVPRPPIDPVGAELRARLDEQAAMLGRMDESHSTAIERWAGHIPGRDELFELWAAVTAFYEHGRATDNFLSRYRGGMRDRRLMPLATDPWLSGMRSLRMGEDETQAMMSYFSARFAAQRYYAWATTAPWLLKALAHFAAGKGVVDPMAGTGWWALRLAEAHGVDVAAYDLNPPCTGSTRPFEGDDPTTVRPVAWGNGYHADTTTWTRVDRADAEWSAARHPDRVLLLAWPPYDTGDGAAAIKAHAQAGGRRVAYVGEGDGGCTGDDEMHEILEKRYAQVTTLPCAQWDGLHDWMELYEREEAS